MKFINSASVSCPAESLPIEGERQNAVRHFGRPYAGLVTEIAVSQLHGLNSDAGTTVTTGKRSSHWAGRILKTVT